MLKISIPEPCHEDWNKMTPDETGRHCSSCAKSVVDFTAMSDDEVKHFFLNKKEEQTCGRFKQSQLQQIVIELPQNIFSIEMPLWKKFLAACLIVFSTSLFSCDTKINDQVVIQKQTEVIEPGLVGDNVYVGGIAMSYDMVTVPVETCTTVVGYIAPPIFVIDTTASDNTGLVELIPEDPISQKADTVVTPVKPDEKIFIGDSIYGEEFPIKKPKIDSTGNTPKIKKTLRPDEAVELNCRITMGLPILVVENKKLKDDPQKIKDPPKADSIDCKTIKNYY